MGIQSMLVDSPLGQLLVKASETYVHAILFTNVTKHVIPQVINAPEPANEYPVLQQCRQQLQEYFAGSRLQFELPLAQEGTNFQQLIWAALVKIPYGKTISYLQLSKMIGNTKAIRAVGTANGNNNLSIIVPCHRVIGSDGSLTGYAGELWRKKWLLEHEGKYANGVQTLF